MTESGPGDITRLLSQWTGGDAEALDQLMPLLYERLRSLARHRRRGDVDASLNTTGLVHEAYLKLVATEGLRIRDRGHFLGLASRIMRHLLVDHARARKALKRGTTDQAIEALEADMVMSDDMAESTLDLDGALQRLAHFDERRSRILELRYFGGLSLEEITEALDVSLATVKRELRAARAWLAMELGREQA